RRHTRFSRDWSSDVCSSDLLQKNARANENSSSYTQSALPLIISLYLPSVVICVSAPVFRSVKKRLLSRTKATLLPSGEKEAYICLPSFCETGVIFLVFRSYT